MCRLLWFDYQSAQVVLDSFPPKGNIICIIHLSKRDFNLFSLIHFEAYIYRSEENKKIIKNPFSQHSLLITVLPKILIRFETIQQ